ncbi:MAG: cysteate synthase [Rikenellaceae bacterium]
MKNKFNPTKYQLETFVTKRVFNDDSKWTLDDCECEQPSLIRAVYEKQQLELKDDSWGIYKFADWLPISRTLEGSAAPVTYKSEKLAQYLGLENLYITLNGYHPEVGALMATCSFKETEAYSVCGRLSPDNGKTLVVASAGNTARAFAKVCSENNIPLLLCVPKDNINALWSEKPINDCVKLVVSESGSDYFDAIHISNVAVKDDRFLAEGGAKNIARRDGMATTMLSAVTTIGEIPDYYFQAIGSGTGAIAAWEANLRFIADGRYGNKLSKLMLSQNAPFLPMYDAWKIKSRALLPLDDNLARKQVEEIKAKVLSNRKPPYSIAGGLFDALVETDGEIMCATNAEAKEAARIFEECEGVDIYSASAVACATLIDAVKNNLIDKSKIVMLNITGAGEKKLQKNKELHYLQPSAEFSVDADDQTILKKLAEIFF